MLQKLGQIILAAAMLLTGSPVVTVQAEEEPAHEHTYTETERVEPTCQKEGYITKECECHDKVTEVLPKKEHSYKKEQKAATYAEKGWTKYTCVECQDTYTENEQEALSIPKVGNINWATTDSTIKLSWQSIKGCSYEIAVKEGETWKVKMTTDKASAELKKMASGAGYSIRIRAKAGSRHGEWSYTKPITRVSQPQVKLKAYGEKITLTWSKVPGVTEYRVWVKSATDKKFILKKKVAKTKTSATFINLAGNKPYSYQIEAVQRITSKVTWYSKSKTVTGKPYCETALYKVTRSSRIIWQTGKGYAGWASAGAYYTGYYSFNYRGYICIFYNGRTGLIPYNAVQRQNNAHVLKASVQNQCKGQIYGIAACGPTSLWTLLKYENNYKGTKDDLIRYAESGRFTGMGSMRYMSATSGCDDRSLIEMSSRLTKGKYQLQNVYTSRSKPSVIIEKQLKQGKRCIVNVQYAGYGYYVSTSPWDALHFIVICGYEKTDKGLYFYYADPLAENCIHRVHAGTLNNSMAAISPRERKVILCKK